MESVGIGTVSMVIVEEVFVKEGVLGKRYCPFDLAVVVIEEAMGRKKNVLDPAISAMAVAEEAMV